MFSLSACCCVESDDGSELAILSENLLRAGAGSGSAGVNYASVAAASVSSGGFIADSAEAAGGRDLASLGFGAGDEGADRRLTVPANFMMFSVDAAASSSAGAAGAPQDAGYVSLTAGQKEHEMRKLQSMIRNFVHEFLQGVYLDAVLENGLKVPCWCIMDSRLARLSLKVGSHSRIVSLAEIKEIVSGKELRELRVTTPLDDHCVTLVMQDDQCVSFKFEDVKAREHFATCMKVLRLAIP
eukprot:TRINITY_DN60074_c0_g1_i1.p1 TRINITY_DN60074_c0_g1~~TRINITY_DN60074_c0_g1_i1.p1  ORF type:complete len:241 (-),score=51.79 TRINITY_DN60074_c0_g1_i1:77-799(-)